MADVSGKARVWVNSHKDFDTYSVSIGSKRKDGSWMNAYQEVRFKGELPKPNNGDEIRFEGFTVVREFEGNDGKKRGVVVWMITAYDNLSNTTEKTATGSNFGSQAHTDGEQVSGFSQLMDDDVPF